MNLNIISSELMRISKDLEAKTGPDSIVEDINEILRDKIEPAFDEILDLLHRSNRDFEVLNRHQVLPSISDLKDLVIKAQKATQEIGSKGLEDLDRVLQNFEY